MKDIPNKKDQSARLESIDALRGLDMFLITGVAFPISMARRLSEFGMNR